MCSNFVDLFNFYLKFSENEFHMCFPGELSPFFPKCTGIHDVEAGYEYGRDWQYKSLFLLKG